MSRVKIGPFAVGRGSDVYQNAISLFGSAFMPTNFFEINDKPTHYKEIHFSIDTCQLTETQGFHLASGSPCPFTFRNISMKGDLSLVHGALRVMSIEKDFRKLANNFSCIATDVKVDGDVKVDKNKQKEN